MPSLLKKKQFWGGIIAAGILIFLFYDLDIPQIISLAKNLRLEFLAPVLVCSTFIILFKALRWITIVSKVRKVFVWPALCMYSAAQGIGMMLPALTGQAGRVILFSRKGNFTKTFAFSTIFLEICFDAIGLISLMLVSSSVFAFPEKYRIVSYVIATVTLLFFVLFYISLYSQNKMEKFGYHRIRPKSPRIYIMLRRFFRSFNEGISCMKSTDKIFVVSFYTLLSWMSQVGVVYFLIYMFDFNLSISREWAAIVVIIINYLALMFPITPGNAGTFQLAVVGGLRIFGVAKTEAVLFSVILYLADLLPIFILAAFFMFKEKMSISEISEDEREIEEVERMVMETDLPAGEGGVKHD